jgi:hypothetical protein
MTGQAVLAPVTMPVDKKNEVEKRLLLDCLLSLWTGAPRLAQANGAFEA